MKIKPANRGWRKEESFPELKNGLFDMAVLSNKFKERGDFETLTNFPFVKLFRYCGTCRSDLDPGRKLHLNSTQFPFWWSWLTQFWFLDLWNQTLTSVDIYSAYFANFPKFKDFLLKKSHNNWKPFGGLCF